MNVKTEKWRIELVELVQRCFVKKINSEEYTIDRHALIQGTLKVCKESGLKFVPSVWKLGNLCYASQRDEDVRDATLIAVNSKIEGIDV